MINSIILYDPNGIQTELKLHIGQQPYNVEQILRTKTVVKSDVLYKIYINADEKIEDVLVCLNGEEQRAVLNDNQLIFPDAKQGKIFIDCIGFIQFSININSGESDERVTYFSEYASVLIRSTDTNHHIDEMLRYIYRNQSDILKKQVSMTDIGSSVIDKYDDFGSQLVILEEIVNVYEQNYGFFKANSRYKLEQVEKIDQIDHLKYIDAKTIQYITQHPEYLKAEKEGIRYGKQRFLPNKTLMVQNRMTRDIYENRVVVGFLKKVISSCNDLNNKIEHFLNELLFEDETENGYIVSSHILYLNALDTFRNFKKRIDEINGKLQYLLGYYKKALEIEDVSDFILKPTQIFLSVPQYNRVYLCIVKWLRKEGYDLNLEKAMLNFLNAPDIYEAYVLLKLINQFKSWGYRLIETEHINYPTSGRIPHSGNDYNNKFIFRDDFNTITLYYEPYIFDHDTRNVSGIALYRNNSISLSRDGKTENRGYFYCPDYIIKSEKNGEEHYIICDAKFSHLETVRGVRVPELIYKYLFSISSVNDNAELMGMTAFYALSDEQYQMTDFYDRKINDNIRPFVNMVPMNESIVWEEQENNLLGIIRALTK